MIPNHEYNQTPHADQERNNPELTAVLLVTQDLDDLNVFEGNSVVEEGVPSTVIRVQPHHTTCQVVLQQLGVVRVHGVECVLEGVGWVGIAVEVRGWESGKGGGREEGGKEEGQRERGRGRREEEAGGGREGEEGDCV